MVTNALATTLRNDVSVQTESELGKFDTSSHGRSGPFASLHAYQCSDQHGHRGAPPGGAGKSVSPLQELGNKFQNLCAKMRRHEKAVARAIAGSSPPSYADFCRSGSYVDAYQHTHGQVALERSSGRFTHDPYACPGGLFAGSEHFAGASGYDEYVGGDYFSRSPFAHREVVPMVCALQPGAHGANSRDVCHVHQEPEDSGSAGLRQSDVGNLQAAGLGATGPSLLSVGPPGPRRCDSPLAGKGLVQGRPQLVAGKDYRSDVAVNSHDLLEDSIQVGRDDTVDDRELYRGDPRGGDCVLVDAAEGSESRPVHPFDVYGYSRSVDGRDCSPSEVDECVACP